MQLNAVASLLWYLTISSEVVLAALVLRRRAFRSFPFFAFYILLCVPRSLFVWAMYRWAGYASRPAFYAYWSTQAILLIARGLASAELPWQVLRNRPRLLWTLARDVLLALGVLGFLYAAFDFVRDILRITNLILAVERDLELTIAIILICFLLLAPRYKIAIQRAHFLLAVGLCLYSLVQAAIDSLLYWLPRQFALWSNLHTIAFQIALVLWILAFKGRADETEDEPVQMIPDLYEQHAEEVSLRLRALENDLEEITRK
jgi:hypothetical protein